MHEPCMAPKGCACALSSLETNTTSKRFSSSLAISYAAASCGVNPAQRDKAAARVRRAHRTAPSRHGSSVLRTAAGRAPVRRELPAAEREHFSWRAQGDNSAIAKRRWQKVRFERVRGARTAQPPCPLAPRWLRPSLPPCSPAWWLPPRTGPFSRRGGCLSGCYFLPERSRPACI